jgi:hypothetical protein
MALPTIAIVGDWTDAIFADAVAWLRANAACELFESPAAALTSTLRNQNSWPIAVVVLQARPGQFAAAQIELLHAQWPLSRLIALVGPWCEGELRSGRPWSGVARVPWKSWQQRLAMELGLQDVAQAPLPRTTTAIERIEAAVISVTQGPRPSRTATICTANQATWDYFADALMQLGCKVTAASSADKAHSPVDVLLFDGWENLPLEERRLERADSLPKRILLLHFPRPTDQARARSLGIDAVISHAVALDELAIALDGAIANFS